jgi:hypothetical protein
MAHDDYRPRKHFDNEMSLSLVGEEAMSLDDHLDWQNKTAKVQVSVTFKDDNGRVYAATRIVKMRLKLEE